MNIKEFYILKSLKKQYRNLYIKNKDNIRYINFLINKDLLNNLNRLNIEYTINKDIIEIDLFKQNRALKDYFQVESFLNDTLKDYKKSDSNGFKGFNFVTNNIYGYYMIGSHKIEISYGDFLDRYLIGITALNDPDQKISKCFNVFQLKPFKEYLKILSK